MLLLAAVTGCAPPEPGQPPSELPTFLFDLSNGKAAASADPNPRPVPAPHSVIRVQIGPPPYFMDERTWAWAVWEALWLWEEASAGMRSFVPADSSDPAELTLRWVDVRHNDGCDAGFSAINTVAHTMTVGSGCQDGLVHFNTQLDWVWDGSDRLGTVDVESAVVHEVGHYLGLPHVNEPGLVMNQHYTRAARRITDQEAELLLEILGVLP